MEVYLIRHTTPDIEKGICYGQADIGVAATFENEVTEIKKKHPKILNLNAAIFSSPLKRCSILAEKLFNKPIAFDSRLKELDFGNWELKNWDAIDKNEFTPWMEDFVNVKVTNGESYVDLQNRVVDFFNELKAKNCKRIIVITHAGVIRSIISHSNKKTLHKSFEIKVSYGEIFKLNL